MDGATVRWEHVDLDAGKLHRPNPKGGKKRAFSIPLSSECVRILERRRSDNHVVFAQVDGGWVFPTRALKEKACALCAALGQKPHSAGAVVHLISHPTVMKNRWNRDLVHVSSGSSRPLETGRPPFDAAMICQPGALRR